MRDGRRLELICDGRWKRTSSRSSVWPFWHGTRKVFLSERNLFKRAKTNEREREKELEEKLEEEEEEEENS